MQSSASSRQRAPHKKAEELEPLFNGDMVGRWEGDTLIIDTVSIDERTWIQDGWFYSDALHVIERFRRPSMNYATMYQRGAKPRSVVRF